MRAYHVLDSSPKTALGGEYSPFDFDLLCQIISALTWKKNNGPIGLATDELSLKLLGPIASLYDEIISLPSVDDIDNVAFWAAGKIYALGEISAPCAIIDTDFIVWDRLNLSSGVTVAHREPINPDVYPDTECFATSKEYAFNLRWDRSVLPCNTAFVAFSDNGFKDYYVSESKKFMRACHECDNVLTYMVFAEQRLLAMCADEKNTPINTLMDFDRLGDPSYRYTHLWGYKQALREFPSEKEDFCRRCARRIISDFPEYVKILKNCDTISKYFGDD